VKLRTLIVGASPSPSSLACARPDTPPADHDVVWVRGRPRGPTTLTFTPSEPNGPGGAQSCRAGVCVAAVQVTMTLTSFPPVGQALSSGKVAEGPEARTATGSYSLQLVDGTTLSGTFVAVTCAVLMCG
jgi:hypothetical protein